MTFRKNGGFTLMELMVTILVSTLVTAAAATTILFGLRINKQSADTQTQQSTTRILLSILEDMAAEGTIGQVVTNYGSWEVRAEPADPSAPDAEGAMLMHFENGTIYTGEGTEKPIMEEILASEATYDSALHLLTVEIETEEGVFSSTIHCKMGNVTEKGEAADLTELETEAEKLLASLEDSKEARKALLQLLTKQRGSKGWVSPKHPTEPDYYSKWYITTKEGSASWGKNGWNEKTPWCACFVSWGLAQLPADQLTVPADRATAAGEPFWYANVDDFMAYFQEQQEANKEYPNTYWVDMTNPGAPRPNPGDVIFFDREIYDGVQNVDHVGVVLLVKTLAEEGEYDDPTDDVIFTIEGNSLGKVAIREYSVNHPAIVGYGILPWAGSGGGSE